MRRLLPRRPKRLRSVLFGGLVLLVLVVVAWTVVTALLARSRLEAARSGLAALEANPPNQVTALRQAVDHAEQEAASASSLMSQPGPWLFAHLPVIGRSVAAERVIARSASGVLSSLQPVVTQASALSSGGGSSGVSLPALARLAGALTHAARNNAGDLGALDRLDLGLTPGFVSGPAQQAVVELRRAITGLGTAGRAVTALQGVLGADGPRRVMVVLENNAELRGTGGLLASFALGTADAGHLHLGSFRDINTVAAPPDHYQRVPADPSYVAAYGEFLANTTLWRNANMSADTPQSAQVMAALMQRSLHVRPSVIIFVDVPAMTDIITGTGSTVTLPDGTAVGGSDLERALLVQSYGKASLNPAVELRRKAALIAAAGRVFVRLSSLQPSVALLRSLAGAASRRHIMIWSDRPAEESDLNAAGVGGAVDPGNAAIAMVVGQNLGDHAGAGNKLDYYISRRLSYDAVVGRSQASVTETLTMANHVPDGLGPYVAGQVHRNELRELVGIAVPARATVTGFTSGGTAVPEQTLVADGTREVRTIARLPQGRTQSWTLTYTMPVTDGSFTLLGVPQPLANPAQFDVRLRPAAGLRLLGTGPTLVTDPNQVGRSGPWGGEVHLAVRAAGLGWWQSFRHDFSDFWNHKVTL